MPAHSAFSGNGLVKRDLADRLRAEIMNGSLPSGDRVVEAKWAQKFGVAQGSIREAINILALEGFISKEAGRSARVVHLTEVDVAQLYELRGALEGLVARLAAKTRADLSKLESAVVGMRRAASEGNCEALQRIIDLLREAEGEVAEIPSGASYRSCFTLRTLCPTQTVLRLPHCGAYSERRQTDEQRNHSRGRRRAANPTRAASNSFQ